MGKIRVKTFGDEELEQKEVEEARLKKEAKIAAAKGMAKTVEAPVEEEKTAEPETMEEAIETKAEAIEEDETPKEVKHKESKEEKAFHSKKYQALSDQFDKTK